jgi:hypothetical protein
VPAAAVIPAPIAYIKVAAVKKLVVGFLDMTSLAGHGFVRECLARCPSFQWPRVALH